MKSKLSLHDPHTNKRLTQTAKVADCSQIKLLRWRTWLVPLVRTSSTQVPRKEGLLPPPDESRGISAGRLR
jgi:hypothetical protein